MEWRKVVVEFEEYVYANKSVDIEKRFRELARGRSSLEVIELYGIVSGYDINLAIQILSQFSIEDEIMLREEPESQWQLAESL